jgi:hypothetical protein
MLGKIFSKIDKSNPNKNYHIIIHFLGFLAIISGVIYLSLYQAISPVARPRFLSPNTIRQVFFSNKTTPDYQSYCQPPTKPKLPDNFPSGDNYQIINYEKDTDNIIVSRKIDDNWTIYKYNSDTDNLSVLVENISFNSESLTLSYSPISNYIVYPQCQNHACLINISNLNTSLNTQIPAVYGIPDPPLADLFNLFFDETNQIISYTTNPEIGSNRVILDWQGNIIHQIDESPGINRILIFSHYASQPNLLVYKDTKSGITNFLNADRVSLTRYFCPALD